MCFKLALVENFLEKFQHRFQRSRWTLGTAVLIVQLVGKHKQTQLLFHKMIFLNKEISLTL
jgi:hypothetical protein